MENNVAPLLAKLHDPDAHERWIALQQLGRLADEHVLRPLLDLALVDDNADMRREAIWIVATSLRAGKVTFLQACQSLIVALDNPHPMVRSNAVVALSRIYQEGETEDLVAPKILTLLHDPDAYVRLQAAWWMLKHGDNRARPDLESLLTDPDLDVRDMAKRALETIN